ncbi:MAG: MFS transporter [Desulfobacterales bacterium]
MRAICPKPYHCGKFIDKYFRYAYKKEYVHRENNPVKRLKALIMVNTQNSNTHAFYTPARLGPILFLALLFFLSFIARVVLSPLMPAIETELSISHSQAGALFLFMSLGYFIALLGSGFLSARITHKYSIVVSTTVVGVALLVIASSRDLLALRAAIFFLGMAAGLYLPSGMTTITDMVDSRHWGKSVSIHEIAPNLGFVAAPIIAEILMLWFSWRVVPTVIGYAAICIGLLFARVGKWGNFPGHPPSFSAVKCVFAKKSFWIMVGLFGLAISSTMGIYTMLPLYLIKEIDMSGGLANSLISLSRLAGMGTALISGWATDRFGAARTIMWGFLLTGITTILLGMVASKSTAAVMVFLQAILATIYFPAGFTALSSLFTADIRNVAISFTIPFAFVFGSGIVPSMIGYTGDMGAFSTGFAITGMMILAGAALPLFLKLTPDPSC